MSAYFGAGYFGVRFFGGAAPDATPEPTPDPTPTPAPTPEPTAPPVQIVQSGGGNSMGIRFLPITLPHQLKPEMSPPKRPIEEDEALLLL